MSALDLVVRIAADGARYSAGMNAMQRATRNSVNFVKAEFAGLKSAFSSVQGQMAGLGLGIGVAKVVQDAGRFEKQMRLLQVSTGDTRADMEGWRQDMLRHQQNTGTLVSTQVELSDSLQAVGLNMKQIRAVIEPASNTMAVAKTNADQLGKAMGVASKHFKIDLTDTNAVETLLDQMLVAGRLGNAELENLPDIFAKVGARAVEANFSMSQTLALIESLSQAEPQSDRLGTLVDSTLRIFSNAKYMKDAAKGTGVRFFNKDGSRRDPLEILQDMKAKYDKLKTDKQRMLFIDKAFGKSDLDTQRGLKQAMDKGTLQEIAKFKKEIEHAKGQAKKDLPTAIDNLPDQINRLTSALRKAVDDGFARPLNDALARGIGKLLNPKEKGGMGLDGQDLMLGGAAAAAVTYVMGRLGMGLAKKIGGLGAGVATGKALEHAAGVTPVYVVNMPSGGVGGGELPIPGLPGGAAGAAAGSAAGAAGSRAALALAMGMPLGQFLGLGAGAWGTAAAGVGLAGAAGYGVGTLAYKSLEGTMAGDGLVDKVGGGIARILALFGNENAKQALAINEKLKNTELGGTMKIVVETSAGASATVTAAPTNPRLRYQVGQTMQGAN
ncbi:phage tail tape measure protein [Chromobacterium haemolyticum]|uniref:Phage tail tape measure protein n=1 Tax=Chromobacterium haemolyticum TaxID=394935 RepID=A0A1W0CCJ7_9NEIS|nr:phage tail tape measure protein [Chromobacterium haemolyticum]OQS32460.1 phage tail tape measure protein [Chromobacterium haemolyticum]